MALGFIKKIFSFGKNEVETVEDGKAAPAVEMPEAVGQGQPMSSGAAPDEAISGALHAEPEAAAAEAARESLPVAEGTEPDAAEPQEPLPKEPQPEEPAPSEPRPAEPGPEVPEPAKPEPEIPEPQVPEPEIPEPQRPEPEIPPAPAPQPEIPETPRSGPGAPQPTDATTARERSVASAESVEHPPARPQEPHESVSEPERDAAEEISEAAEAATASDDAFAAAVTDLLNETPPDAAPEPSGDFAEPSPARPSAFVVDPGKRAAPRPSDASIAPKLSWFQRLRQGLARTSSQLSGQITGIFLKRKLDEDTLQDLEDVLIQADLGVETAMRITDALASGRYGRDVDTAEVTAIMAEEIEKVLGPVARPLELDLSFKPHVILVVGVNGTGKTTTIGKLAAKLTRGGLKVTLAAGDTFRAAAIEQLKIWGERTGSEVVASKLGADAAGLAYEGYERAKANGSDVLIIDTAGRLQNKTELMNELEKIVRVLGKHDPEAPHTVLQTLDATTGQNALNQVEIFRNVAGVNGLVMTKLDGTARGGILVAISARHKLPVYFIGVGEGVDDLEPFAAHEFASAIAGVPVGVDA